MFGEGPYKFVDDAKLARVSIPERGTAQGM